MLPPAPNSYGRINMIAIIPARGNSQRIPGKNIKDFHGKPIISYSINAAKESGLFERIIVSTDDQKIAQVSRRYGAEIHVRSDEMSRDEVGTQEVVGGVLENIGYDNNSRYCACCIYATSPLMSIEDLKSGYDVLTYTLDYVFSVSTNPLRDAGQFYFGWTDNFVEQDPLLGGRTAIIPIADNRVCDINTPEDWARAEVMYAAL